MYSKVMTKLRVPSTGLEPVRSHRAEDFHPTLYLYNQFLNCCGLDYIIIRSGYRVHSL